MIATTETMVADGLGKGWREEIVWGGTRYIREKEREREREKPRCGIE